jgi:hypothetical protein
MNIALFHNLCAYLQLYEINFDDHNALTRGLGSLYRKPTARFTHNNTYLSRLSLLSQRHIYFLPLLCLFSLRMGTLCAALVSNS